jgi:hypothetical protein
MWRRNNKVWTRYGKSIVAVDTEAVYFLEDYLRFISMNRSYLNTIEVYDLQNYKLIKKHKKVGSALREKVNTPFIFFGYKN